jgi:preprotein translocase subunit YajC
MQYSQLIFVVAILAAMWFLLIRPQQQRQKQHQQTVSSLVPGQHIVTIGGLVAEIVEVRGDRLLLKVADGSEMEYVKDAVGRVLPADELMAEDESEDEAGDEVPAPPLPEQPAADDSGDSEGEQ